MPQMYRMVALTPSTTTGTGNAIAFGQRNIAMQPISSSAKQRGPDLPQAELTLEQSEARYWAECAEPGAAPDTLDLNPAVKAKLQAESE